MIKIYRMSEFDWVAAETLKDAVQCLADILNSGKIDKNFEREYLDKPRELTDEEMDTLVFQDEIGNNRSKKRTFRKELEKRIKSKTKFPELFAVQE